MSDSKKKKKHSKIHLFSLLVSSASQNKFSEKKNRFRSQMKITNSKYIIIFGEKNALFMPSVGICSSNSDIFDQKKKQEKQEIKQSIDRRNFVRMLSLSGHVFDHKFQIKFKFVKKKLK